MIKRILTCVLTCILTCTLTVQAATMDEYREVAREATRVCVAYKNPCMIIAIPHDKMWANTRYGGDIRVSTELIYRMNKEQLRGVIYHELGHHILNHIEKLVEYMMDNPTEGGYNKEAYNQFRRKHELEADRFAVYLSLFLFNDADLEGALKMLTPPEDYYKTHPSHPSTYERIRQMELIRRNQRGRYGF